jgi:hypothetical protein
MSTNLRHYQHHALTPPRTVGYTLHRCHTSRVSVMGREAVIRQCPPRAVLGIGRSAPIAAERAAHDRQLGTPP